MEVIEIFGRLALAFGIGLMIGIERGWSTRELQAGTRALGVRTFSLIGLLGGGIGFAGQVTDDLVTALGVVGFSALVVTIYFTGLQRDGRRGATTEIAAILTFILGLIAVRGDMAVAAAAAVVVAATLDIKEPLHRWIERIESDELTAAIKLLVISVVILPVLPNEGYGPGEAINPYILWWIVVVIAAISFAAYASMRIFGEKVGAAGTGLLGGLVSSTATTVAFARFAKTHAPLSRAAASGMALACAVMFLRALALTGILFKPAVDTLWLPLVAASLTSALLGGILSLHSVKKGSEDALHLQATADIGTGVKFVAIFIAIAVATEYARRYLGDQGAIVTSALGGVVDVDATNATMARLGAAGSVSVGDVVAAVLIAATVNSIAKAVYAIVIAGRRFTPIALLVFLLPVAIGGVAYVMQRSL